MSHTKRRKQALIKADGSKSSISLEPEFWSALKEIAHEQGTNATALVRQVDTFAQINLTSAVRVFVLQHFKAKLKHSSRTGSHEPPREAAPYQVE
ncbi:Ribbon-helix-helix domain-containing protein [Bradyrhizobium sp. NFR13]|uniref:ribbon-helix-helix domain-containing protein n=1 Tax=Bradyrhizobium sp. NFR13 TaxID=1566285 RepID=UPI0008DF4964|nr:Ribbon-helix-helix domain-containing protein [Bradyrhizobium sp. NFR13]